MQSATTLPSVQFEQGNKRSPSDMASSQFTPPVMKMKLRLRDHPRMKSPVEADEPILCGEPHLSLYGTPYNAEKTNQSMVSASQTVLDLQYKSIEEMERSRNPVGTILAASDVIDLTSEIISLDDIGWDCSPIELDYDKLFDESDVVFVKSELVRAESTSDQPSAKCQLEAEMKKPPAYFKERKRGKDILRLVDQRNRELEDKEIDIELQVSDLKERKVAMEQRAKSLLRDLKKNDEAIRRKRRKLLNMERAHIERSNSLAAFERQMFRTHQEHQQVSDCFICFEAPIDCILVPCGHMVACMACATKLKKVCCICNQRSRPQKIYRV